MTDQQGNAHETAEIKVYTIEESGYLCYYDPDGGAAWITAEDPVNARSYR